MLKSYECGVSGSPHTQDINAESAGKAKSRYQREYLDALDIPYTSITCRCTGEARSPAPTRTELAQREADLFNARYPVGTIVRYWSWLREGEPTGIAAIKHEATVVCEGAVAWMAGVSSCHSLSHVEAMGAEEGASGQPDSQASEAATASQGGVA